MSHPYRNRLELESDSVAARQADRRSAIDLVVGEPGRQRGHDGDGAEILAAEIDATSIAEIG